MAKKAASKKRTKSDKSDASTGAVDSMARLHLWQIQAVRDVLLVLAVVGVVWMGYALRAVTVPLLVALLLAYLFEPVIEWLCRHPRWKLTRLRAVTLLLVAVGGALLVGLAATLPIVIGQTNNLIEYVSRGDLRDDVAKLTASMPEAVREDYRGFLRLLPGADASGPVAEPAGDDAVPAALTEQDVRAIVAGEFQRQQQGANKPAPNWLGFARGGAATLMSILGTIIQIGLIAFLVPFYFFFFSLWYPAVVRFGRGLIPQGNKKRILDLIKKMDLVVSGFVRGRITISFIMGVLLALGWLICGVPHAIPLGLLVGIFCAVPYLGVVGIPLAAGLLFFQEFREQDGVWGLWVFWAILWPTVVFVIVQLIEGYVLTPMIAGKVTNLDPVTIIVAVLAGGSVLGVYGMLLAIPAAACGKILFTEVLLPRIQAWTRGEVADPLPIERGQ